MQPTRTNNDDHQVSVVTTTRAGQDSVLAAMRHQSAAQEVCVHVDRITDTRPS